MKAIEFHIYIEFGGNHSLWPCTITEIGIGVDVLFYAEEIIEARRITSFRLLAVKYCFIYTAAIPDLYIVVHVDKFWMLK